MVNEISNVLIWLLRFGCIFRVVFCLIRSSISEEDAGAYKKRMKSVIIFYILAELVWEVKDLILAYYT